MTSENHVYDVEEHEATVLLLSGMARVAEDGVLELTPKGSEWLRAWCKDWLAKYTIAESLS